MISINLKKFLNYIFIITFIFILDRVSKLYILKLAEAGNVNVEINSYLNLILVWNAGIGFGLFSFNQPIFYNIITAIIIIINLILLYLIYKSTGFKSYFFTLVLGGSLGNLFDRLYYSAVPDFIDINYMGYHWFIFNVADIFITLGIFCVIFDEVLNYKK